MSLNKYHTESLLLICCLRWCHDIDLCWCMSIVLQIFHDGRDHLLLSARVHFCTLYGTTQSHDMEECQNQLPMSKLRKKHLRASTDIHRLVLAFTSVYSVQVSLLWYRKKYNIFIVPVCIFNLTSKNSHQRQPIIVWYLLRPSISNSSEQSISRVLRVCNGAVLMWFETKHALILSHDPNYVLSCH
jgi:hypothetical protein